jgi:hypothetical protein
MFCEYSYCHKFFKHQLSNSYKEENIDSSNTQIYDRALAWLCTGTAIKKKWRWGWEWVASCMCPNLFLLVTEILSSEGQNAINVIPWRGQTG